MPRARSKSQSQSCDNDHEEVMRDHELLICGATNEAGGHRPQAGGPACEWKSPRGIFLSKSIGRVILLSRYNAVRERPKEGLPADTFVNLSCASKSLALRLAAREVIHLMQ